MNNQKPTESHIQKIKDHQKRELINKLKDVAIEFAGTQQLREQIAKIVIKTLEEWNI